MQNTIINQKVLAVAIAILSYLRDNPSAKDTAAGVAKWWVGEKQKIVEEALKLLISEGVVLEEKNMYFLAIQKSAVTTEAAVKQSIQRLRELN